MAEQHADAHESASKSHLFVFTANKAGMGGVDKQKVNHVIHEMSKGSAFYSHAVSQDEKTTAKIAELKAKLAILDTSSTSTSTAHSALLKRVAMAEARLESKRFCGRPCVVVDMDMFYAAVVDTL
mmetsp:Transcript_10898/g.25525  ORF Transcript_10898/g.25525 Transcript_10898/m.25525 type:complete len:125 (+) Transcript_10898:65-439(+)